MTFFQSILHFRLFSISDWSFKINGNSLGFFVVFESLFITKQRVSFWFTEIRTVCIWNPWKDKLFLDHTQLPLKSGSCGLWPYHPEHAESRWSWKLSRVRPAWEIMWSLASSQSLRLSLQLVLHFLRNRCGSWPSVSPATLLLHQWHMKVWIVLPVFRDSSYEFFNSVKFPRCRIMLTVTRQTITFLPSRINNC